MHITSNHMGATMIEHNFLKPQKFSAGARFELCHIRRDEGWSQWSQHRIVIGLRDTSKLMKSGHQFGICIVQSFNAPLLGFDHLLLLFHNALHFFLVMAKLIFNIHQPIKSILNSIKSIQYFKLIYKSTHYLLFSLSCKRKRHAKNFKLFHAKDKHCWYKAHLKTGIV